MASQQHRIKRVTFELEVDREVTGALVHDGVSRFGSAKLTDVLDNRLSPLTDDQELLRIDRLELKFGPGLIILTGETGAGKSILVDALGLVLGVGLGRVQPPDDAALVEHDDAVGQADQLIEVLGDQQHRTALAGQRLQAGAHRCGRPQIQTAGGLGRHQHRGI